MYLCTSQTEREKWHLQRIQIPQSSVFLLQYLKIIINYSNWSCFRNTFLSIFLGHITALVTTACTVRFTYTFFRFDYQNLKNKVELLEYRRFVCTRQFWIHVIRMFAFHRKWWKTNRLHFCTFRCCMKIHVQALCLHNSFRISVRLL